MFRLSRRRLLAAIMCVCILTGMFQTNTYASSSVVKEEKREDHSIQSFDSEDSGTETVRSVSGAAIYVDGTGIGHIEDGTSNNPYLTLKAAADEINNRKPGSYKIIMGGNTNETESISFGNGMSYDISITTASVTGGAITVSRKYTGEKMINVNNNTTLTLEGSSSTNSLVLDGGGSEILELIR